MLEITQSSRLMLYSIIALGLLHIIMTIWVYATRIPALKAARIRPQKTTKAALETLPEWARNPQNNYNNLFEAPTIFYAITITIVLLGFSDIAFVYMAWAYVGLRYIHSIIQSTINIILLRFFVFSLSWLVLGLMIIKSALSITIS